MSPPRKRGGPGGHHPTETATEKIATGTHQQADRPDRSAPTALVAPATLYRRSGRAQHDWLVARCPLGTGHVHRHVLYEANATVIERSPSCAPHRKYMVRVTRVVPAAPSLPERGAVA